jgi:hypothetical protein
MPVAPSPFLLPRGVTGFGDRQWVPRPHALFKELTALSHAVARGIHGRAAGKASDLNGNNFHRLQLEGRGLRVTLFLNAFHPLVGFAETDDDEPVFSDIPEGFIDQDPGTFVFIGKSILLSPPDEVSLSRLASPEIEQMKYWQPRRLGDIIFNHWD